MFSSRRILLFLVIVAWTRITGFAQDYPYHIDTRPTGGLKPTADLIASPLDSVNPTNGGLNVSIPLASLPAGNAGMNFDLALVYNSSLYDLRPDRNHHQSVIVHALQQGGGWDYNFRYKIELETRTFPPGENPFDCLGTAQYEMEHARIYRYRLVLPDGSRHILHLLGYGDEHQDQYWGDGFYGIGLNGMRSYCATQNSNFYPQDHPNQILTWFTDDGSYLRLLYHTGTTEWTLHFTDGRKVTGTGSEAEFIYDANGNYIQIWNTLENGKTVTYLTDQYNRSIRIEKGYTSSATEKEDKITVASPSGSLEWRVKWELLQIGNPPGNPPTTYLCYEDGQYSPPLLVDCLLNFSFWAVKYVQTPLAEPNFSPPPATPWATYEFTYAVGSGNFGHLQSMRVPSGALYEYQWGTGPSYNPMYMLVEADGIAYGRYFTRQVTHDGTSDLWTYAITETSSTVTAPDGGTTVYSFYDPLPWSLGWTRGLVYKIQEPEGKVTKRQWARNKIWGLAASNASPNNPYVERESVTLNAVHGEPRSAVTDYLYDKNGNLLSKKDYDWYYYDANAAMDPPGALLRVTESSYYVSVPAASDTSFASNRYWHWEAPARLDAVKRQQITDGSTAKAVSEFEYDNAEANGNVTLERRWDNAKPGCTANVPLPSACPSFERSYVPDGTGRLEHIYEPAISTHLFYDNGPLPTRVDYGYPGTPAYKRFEYDWNVGLGLLNSTTDVVKGTAVTYTYDGYGRLTIENEAGLRETETLYYPDIRTVVVNHDLDTLGDGKLQVVTRTDEVGRVDLVRTSDGSPLTSQGTDGIKVQTSYAFFAGGSRAIQSSPYRTTADATLEWTCTEKDQLGRVVAVATFKGAASPTDCQSSADRAGIATTAYEVDSGMPRIRTIDAAGKTRETISDPLGRLNLVVEDPAGLNYFTNYGYDQLGNLLAVYQGEQVREFSYSSLGRLLTALNPETGAQPITYSYFDNGELQSRTDGRGITTSYTYDELHRIKTKTYSDDTPSVTYAYHEPGGNALNVGELQAITSTAASTQYNSYDALGRVTSSTHTVSGDASRSFSYTYHLNDAVNTVTNPSGRVIQYNLDDAGRTTSVVAGGTMYADIPLSNASYTADGRIVQMKFGNDLWETRDYQTPGTATVFKLGTLQGPGDKLELEYHFSGNANNGNLLSHVIRQPGRSWTQNYSYDGVNRLQQASEDGGWNRSYGYDQYGNRWVNASSGLQWNDPHEPVASSNFNSANNRLSVANSTFDDVGNQTYFAPFTLAYDAENRTISATSAGSGNAIYSYDGDGRRVRKTWTPDGGSPTTTYYLYNALGQLAAEYSTATAAAGTSYVHTDMLGSTRMVTDASGATAECYDYLPFGRMLSSSDNGRNTGCYASNPDTQADSSLSQKFTGKERDAETRLDYFGARFYSGAQGRFTGPDQPFADQSNGDPQSWNLYAYTRNKPLILIDIDGRQSARPNDGPTIGALPPAAPSQRPLQVGIGFAKGLGQTLVDIGRMIGMPDSNADQFESYLTYSNATQQNGGSVFEISQYMSAAAGIKSAATGAVLFFRRAGLVGQSFKSFSALKRALGSAGEGMVWHHIVEQSKVGEFGAEAIHNTLNVVKLDAQLNADINAYYSGKDFFTNDKTVREWLKGQSWEDQYKFGQDVLRRAQGGEKLR